MIDGIAPQLPLEAAIAIAGGFAHIHESTVATLRYIRADGGEPPGDERDIDLKGKPVSDLATATLDGLKRQVATFDDPNTPYRPLRRPRFSYEFDNYAHLARVAEWSGLDGDDEPAEE